MVGTPSPSLGQLLYAPLKMFCSDKFIRPPGETIEAMSFIARYYELLRRAVTTRRPFSLAAGEPTAHGQLLFIFLAIKHNSTLHAVYALLSAWVGFFLALGSSPVALFFLLVGSVLFLAGVIHFATFILVQRANSRRS